ncbi:MAG: hypothetical protein ACR2LN_04760 [Candidatus Levyibacteriota bacterium]
MKLLTNILIKHQYKLILLFLFIVSALAIEYFFLLGQLTLYADTMSRLDIARKIIDNITPGFAQVGNVWLPLPQILMLPFIWNSYLWHSGLAGSFMSMFMFIIGGYFVYKSVYLLSQSPLRSFLSLLIYSLNINLLYLQSTAMSETALICTISATIYYFLVWTKTKNKMDLIPAGIAVSLMTLTRYEGLAILFASIPMVFMMGLFMYKNRIKSESATIIYTVLAITGFSAWTLYLALIFGDPFYWINYYATPQAVGESHIKLYTQHKSFTVASIQYLTAMIWTIGLIPIIMSILGSVILIYQSFKKKTLYLFPLFLPLAIFLFMVLSLQRNTPIGQPDLTITNILSGKTSHMVGFNIRYGIILIPWVAVMSSFLFSMRNSIVKLLIFSVFFLQIYSYFFPKYTVIYQIPLQIHGGRELTPFGVWLRKNYDGGKILISAMDHEDTMFEMGFNYSTYIHEGNQHFWKDSLKHPARYASWIVLDYGTGISKDPKVKSLMHSPDLKKDYKLVYVENGLRIYKIKHKPYLEIK